MNTEIIYPGIAQDLLQNRRAVIDIGSNSVRLVIYGGPQRTPLSFFNEKDLCGLGTLGEDGALRRAAMDDALYVLERFSRLLREYGDLPVSTFATAAIREATNGVDFIQEICALGLSPIILSGEEEAKYAALGVISGTPAAATRAESGTLNLCGDMGGGSLELTRFSDDAEKPLRDRVSLSLGPLRLISKFGQNPADAESHVTDVLSSLDWLSAVNAGALYAVGGAWRAIAKIHMAKTEYPLPILHQYQIVRSEILDLCGLIERQGPLSLEKMPGVQKKRINTLPHAAMVMRKVLERTQVEKLVISSCGVREGILFNSLSMDTRRQDPLLTLAREYARRYAPDPAFGEAAFELTHGLFKDETAAERKIRQAACIMCDLAALHHPDMRARHASDIILHSPLTGLDHQSRVAISATLYFRHRSKANVWPGHIPETLLSGAPRLKNLAVRLGMALRFASDFSAGSTQIISACSFHSEGDDLVFLAPSELSSLEGYTPSKRLNALAAQLHQDVSDSDTDNGEITARGLFNFAG
ncbi:Ppx/GppA family phosphatase [Parvularcula sp. IMCC14364]|uniref:Ppx/GppA family phosphatase n=1 Tax=Parvularcula sp. IMCC14364 TaxID=3067902 RepID=UPI0027420956|nr:Ppx/GppA family phosphatase [Parvularcula sp. IMCC14364]